MRCTTPDPSGLTDVARLLAEWQQPGGRDDQLHPGDLGWFHRFGAAATASAVRVWDTDGTTVAIGLLDEPDYLRLAFAPDALGDPDLAARIAGDLDDVLVGGKASVEPPAGAALRDVLTGWLDDDPWVPLHRDLAEPVEDPGIAVEMTAPGTAAERVSVQRAAFDRSTFTLDRWHAMAAGAPFAHAADLIGRDADGNAVAAVTVWSAGPGRPGILEPMGVHREFRGVGHGVAITRAAAAALRELGASGASVCTPASNTGAIATYAAAGFEPLPQIRALVRSA